MARTVEESIMNAIIKTFGGKETKPTTSYMAIGNSIPRVGERYECLRLEKDSASNVKFHGIKTSTVREVKNLSNNVFIVTTRNSYYITRVLNIPAENVHFAVISKKPEINSKLNCYKMECSKENIRFVTWQTTNVEEIKFIKGLYKIKTRNSTYICFPMM